MRAGLSFHLIATVNETADRFETLLSGLGLAVERSDPLLQTSEKFQSASNIVLIDLVSDNGIAVADWIAKIDRKQALVIGFGDRLDVRAVSLGLALDLDDFLPMPLDERSLVGQLEAYRDMLAARTELHIRQLTLNEFEEGAAGSELVPKRPDTANDKKVLLVGKTSQLHVQLSGILGPNRFIFAQTAEAALDLLENNSFCIVMFIDFPGGPDASGLIERVKCDKASRAYALLLATHATLLQESREGLWLDMGYDDVLTLPVSPEFLRLRLGFWAAFAKTRLKLIEKPDSMRFPLAVDNLCRMFNYAFAAEYLGHKSDQSEGSGGLGLIAIRVHGLSECNERWNCAVGNRILAFIGDSIRKALRIEDLVVRLYGGLFVAIVGVEDEAVVDRIAERIRWRVDNSLPRFDDVKAPVHISTHVLLVEMSGWHDLDDVVRLASTDARPIALSA